MPQIEVAADREEPLSEEVRSEWQRLSREREPLPPDPQYNGIWRSDDKGMSWEFRGNENGRPMYFSQMRVDPNNPDIVYVVDQRVHKSTDGAQNFERLNGYGHVDQHAFWINPDDSDHLIIGNDGAIDVSYDQGETWEAFRRWAVGQPYHASVDMRRPYYVCTGLQDNGSWCGPSQVRNGDILSEDWYRVGGGDGFYTAVDPTDYTVVYSESQNGKHPAHKSGDRRRRRHPAARAHGKTTRTRTLCRRRRWAPRSAGTGTRRLSCHRTTRTWLYAGGNRLFRSMDRGETWTMSPDLTRNIDRDGVELMGLANSLPKCNRLDRGEECILSRNDGVSRYSTIVSVAESPLVPGLLWVGTDDGNVQVSRDGRRDVDRGGPEPPGWGPWGYYVSRVEGVTFLTRGTAYASLDGHRSDDFAARTCLWTRDYGESWESIASSLPEYGNVEYGAAGSGECAAVVCGDGIRVFCVAGRGWDVAAVHERVAGGAGGRCGGASPGGGPGAGDAWSQRDDRGRYYGVAAVQRRRGPTLRPISSSRATR